MYVIHMKVFFPQIILKFINLIANISYSFYLIHVPIGMGTALFLKLHFQITNPYIQVLSAFCVCLSFSYLCYILFEKSSIQFGKFLIRKLDSRTHKSMALSAYLMKIWVWLKSLIGRKI